MKECHLCLPGATKTLFHQRLPEIPPAGLDILGTKFMDGEVL